MNDRRAVDRRTGGERRHTMHGEQERRKGDRRANQGRGANQ